MQTILTRNLNINEEAKSPNFIRSEWQRQDWRSKDQKNSYSKQPCFAPFYLFNYLHVFKEFQMKINIVWKSTFDPLIFVLFKALSCCKPEQIIILKTKLENKYNHVFPIRIPQIQSKHKTCFCSFLSQLQYYLPCSAERKKVVRHRCDHTTKLNRENQGGQEGDLSEEKKNTLNLVMNGKAQYHLASDNNRHLSFSQIKK